MNPDLLGSHTTAITQFGLAGIDLFRQHCTAAPLYEFHKMLQRLRKAR